MIFIVGGAYQGKTEYAEKNWQGYHIVNRYNHVVKEQLLAGEKPVEQTAVMLEQAKLDGIFPELVIISDELGYGLVPMDVDARIYREINGRVNCLLAQEADQVIRVTAGIGTRIK